MEKKKVKFYEQNSIDSRDNLINRKKIENIIENESNLIMPLDSNPTSNKTFFEYQDLNKQSYNTPLKISEINIKKQFGNYYGHHIGPGKGFGNLNISNDIRHGSSTRLDNFENKINKEKVVNERFDYIDKNYQNPNNLILPFARGGEVTRKSLKAEKFDISDENPIDFIDSFDTIDKSNELHSLENNKYQKQQFYKKVRQPTEIIDNSERMSFNNSIKDFDDKKSKYKFNY